MEIIETFVKGRLKGFLACEDVLVQNTNFVAVIDGVSDRSGRLYGRRSGGRLAADVAQWALHHLDPEATISTCVEQMTQRLARVLDAYDYDYALDRPGASFVAYSSQRREVWSVGDCSFRIDDEVVQGDKEIDRVMLDFRRALIKSCLAVGETVDQLRATDTSREALMPLLQRQHLLANRPGEFGYGVINGLPVPEQFLCVEEVPVDGQEIALASDGYLFVAKTLAESEAYLADDIERDPLRIGDHPGFRAAAPGASFDDRAYIRVRL